MEPAFTWLPALDGVDSASAFINVLFLFQPNRLNRLKHIHRRLRKRGEKFLGSKYIVILVIILTVTDCALVIAELILDLYSVKQTLIATETQTFKFILDTKQRYQLNESETVSSIFDRIAESKILWKASGQLECYNKMCTNQTEQTSPAPFAQREVRDSPGPSGMLRFGIGSNNFSQEDDRTRVTNVFRKTVFVQGQTGNYSNENASYSSSHHRHRRRSRRAFPSNYHRYRTASRDQHGFPIVISIEDILQLLPSDKRAVHKDILERLVSKTSQGFQSCVSQVVRGTRHDVMPLVREIVYAENAKDDLISDTTPHAPDNAASDAEYETHLDKSIAFFQAHIASLISMQLSDIIRAYIPVRYKFPLKHFLRRQSFRESETTSPDLTSLPHIQKNHFLNLKLSHKINNRKSSEKTKEAHRHRRTTHGKTHDNEKQRTDLKTGTMSRYKNTPGLSGSQSAKDHSQDPNTLGKSNLRVYPPETDFARVEQVTPNDQSLHQSYNRRTKRDASTTTDGHHGKGVNKNNDHNPEQHSMRMELQHSRELEIAHKLHYASVFVVSVLLIMVIMKVICKGSNFLKRKIEVFDAVVVVTSVVVDLIFIKGLSEFAVDETIFVLALLLPWRVIRVVNSLVMAVIDHEHVKLRLLYSRKKKLDRTVETLRTETDELKGMLQDVRQFCIKEGIDSSRIDSLLGKFAPRRRKDSKFYTLVKLVMSTASINNNDNDSISSSSMENDLRDYANRQSVLNEAASNEGTVSSLRQYLSVPFFSTSVPGPGSSAVSSDQESVSYGGSLDGGGGDTRRSRADSLLSKPSIFITAPPSDEVLSLKDMDVELGVGRRSPCGSDLDGSVGSDGDVEDLEFSDVFEEDEGIGEREVFLGNCQTHQADLTVEDNDQNYGSGKTEVAFYLGSQASLNHISFLDEHAPSTDATRCNDLQGRRSTGDMESESSIIVGESAGCSGIAIVPNKNLQPRKFGRFLTVPMCTVPAATVTTRALLNEAATNNNNNEAPTGVESEENAAASSTEVSQGNVLISDEASSNIDSESNANVASAASPTELKASCSLENKHLKVETNALMLPQNSAASGEERRKRFASASPPKIVSSLDMEVAQAAAKAWMRRSLPDHMSRKPPGSAKSDSSPLLMKDLRHRDHSPCPPYGSPVPRRRLPEVRTRRKTYATVSCRSDSSDSDIPRPLLHYPQPRKEQIDQHQSDGTISNANSNSNNNSSSTQHPHHKRRHHSGGLARKRHSSGEEFSSLNQSPFSSLLPPRQHSDASSTSRARSESPGFSAMSLLKVPGYDNRRRSVDSAGGDARMDNSKGIKFVSSSKSMNDVTSDGNGNPFANNIGRDGKILRSSCLSLNSARHKRRGKSPHRVSFKVS